MYFLFCPDAKACRFPAGKVLQSAVLSSWSQRGFCELYTPFSIINLYNQQDHVHVPVQQEPNGISVGNHMGLSEIWK